MREDAAEGPLLGRKERRPAARPRLMRPRDVYALAVMFGVTAVLTCLVLWWMDLFSTGVWENEGNSRVHFLTGTPDVMTEFLEARPTDKVAFAFYSTTCPHCKRMRAPFLNASHAFPGVTFIAIDASQSMELADKYQIDAVPAVMFMPIARRPDRFATYPGPPNFDELQKYLASMEKSSDRLVREGLI
jgi:thiol-disulfide isomerase/thioredoxin